MQEHDITLRPEQVNHTHVIANCQRKAKYLKFVAFKRCSGNLDFSSTNL